MYLKYAVLLAQGDWVFLANCHLSLSWMPQLDKIVEEELQNQTPHQDFRLWLSSTPHPGFPISILQAGIKMTTEPPKVRMSVERGRLSGRDGWTGRQQIRAVSLYSRNLYFHYHR